MMKRLASSALLKPRAQVALLLLASCSFQKFDYLQDDGGSAAASGGGTGSVAGSGNQQSGSDSGGTEQSEAGRGGKGSAGKDTGPVENAGESPIEEGGAPGAAGVDNGGSTVTGGSVSGGTGGMGGSGGTGNTGATGALVNPSFESGTTSGWTVEPEDALSKRHAFVQYAQGASSVPDGTYQFSTWHMTDVYTVDLFQVITGLEDGTYVFKAYFSRGAQNAVTLYARNCGGADPDPVDVPITSGTEWLPVSVAGIEVSGGSCEVGLSIDSNQENWLNADLFTFEKDSE
jgi:hypothetical protein